MNSTILAVVVGALATLPATVLLQFLTIWKDERQWKREQEAERERRGAEERRQECVLLRELYQQALQALGEYLSVLDSAGPSGPEPELTETFFRPMALLAMRHPGSDLAMSLACTQRKPGWVPADALRKELLALADTEEGLFVVSPPTGKPQAKPQEQKAGERSAVVQIAAEFRKEQFVEGLELPGSCGIRFRLSDVTKEQRAKLLAASASSYLPESFTLTVPARTPGSNRITRETWKARINPLVLSPSDVVSAWEQDYDRALREIERQGQPTADGEQA